ncbi:MAG: ParB/RepB/Spo0J family partition protein [Erysipelotrichaceae bacterium]|nr:ParB/RepB/Spo0J family partition protein [Erysipelotrichaceae bacterium]
MATKRLGKGLNAIFGDNLEAALQDIEKGNIEVSSRNTEIEIAQIRPNPYQPRISFDEDKLKELAESIKIHGVFQPILVRKSIQGYEIISGERRTRASKIAGKQTIPAIVLEFNDEQMMEISLLENIQREDLSAIEEGKAYQSLINNLNYTQEELAKRIGKSREHITNTMRLLKLPLTIQKHLEEGKLSAGAARSLLSLEHEEQMLELEKRIINEGMSVRAIEKACKELKNPSPKINNIKKVDSSLNYVRETIERKINTKTEVTKNKIIINYQNTDDLNRILEILGLIEEE